MRKGFTLAEIMIVLSVIAILTAILLPSARNAMPNEDVMKFKKAHNTLYAAVRELVNSNKYYLNGDLGVNASGDKLIDSEDTKGYFCQALADLINAKSTDCNIKGTTFSSAIFTNGNDAFTTAYQANSVTEDTLKAAMNKLDSVCGWVQSVAKKEIVFGDDIIFYSTNTTGFGSCTVKNPDGTFAEYKRYFSPPKQFPANFADDMGLDVVYKIFCIDIDNFNEGEAPFGYGIRADGKILSGTRAQQWFTKSIQEKN